MPTIKTLTAAGFIWLASIAVAFAQLFVNGGELYWLEEPEEFALYYHLHKHRIVIDPSHPDAGHDYDGSKVPSYMPRSLQYAWADRISQGFGVIDSFGEDRVLRPSSNIYKSIKHGMQRADTHVWFFPNRHCYLTGAPDEYVDAIEDAKLDAKSDAKLILFGRYDVASVNRGLDGKPVNTPQYIADNMKRLRKLPFDALTVYLREGDEYFYQGLERKIFSSQRVTEREFLDALAPLKGQTRFELFVECDAGLALTPNVFDDKGWKVLISNLKRLASAIKATGLHGVFMDTENYEGEKCWLSHQDKSTLAKAQAKAFERGQQVREALGNLTIITTIAPIFSMTEGHQWGKDYELLGPFLVGMVGGKE